MPDPHEASQTRAGPQRGRHLVHDDGKRGLCGRDAGTEIVAVQNCNIANNVTGGIRSDNASTLRLANSTVTGNPTGLITSGTGQIISMGNNWIQGNTTNGTPTSTLGGS